MGTDNYQLFHISYFFIIIKGREREVEVKRDGPSAAEVQKDQSMVKGERRIVADLDRQRTGIVAERKSMNSVLLT